MDINQISLAKKIWLLLSSVAMAIGAVFLLYKGVFDFLHLWSSFQTKSEIIYLSSDIFWMVLLPFLMIPLCLAAIIKILWNPHFMQVHGKTMVRAIGFFAIFAMIAGPIGYLIIKAQLKDIGYQLCGFTDSSRYSTTSAWAYGDKLKCPYSEIFAY